jgi:MiaB-like tRNA modifying enzyme
MKFYLETYGCSLNASDSDIIVGRLKELSGERVEDESEAELIILNTCGVKEPTEDKIIHRLSQLSGKSVPVIIAGCLPLISRHRIETTIPDYAAMIGPKSIEALDSVLSRILEGERGIDSIESTDASKLQWFEGPPESVICTVPICEGCLGNCAYCAVKFARGEVCSHSIADVSSIVTRCVHQGYREIRLTSQDAGVYGSDTGESLVDLMRALAEIEGPHRFRLGMFNPNLVLTSIDDLVEAMSSDQFFQFFHVPLQSGSDAVLQAMGRLYTVQEWEWVVDRIRQRLPHATIATDIIVGFPGETDSDFEQTMTLLHRAKLPVVNISKYGDRPGTLASKSKQKVDTAVKKNRSRELTLLVNEIALATNQSWIGWTGPVIVTEPGSKGGWMSRNPSYKLVILEGDYQPGTLLQVRIAHAERTHLVAEPIT